MTAEQFLDAAIQVARTVEADLPRRTLSRYKPFLGFGFLVRQRRLAEAIRTLGTASAYEGRMLLRTMVEIYINYSWIRQDKGYSRAVRFIRFEPLERRQVLEDIKAVIPEQRAAASLHRFEQERRATRHLFRVLDPKRNRHKWAGSWATIPSLRDRYVELLRLEAVKAKKPTSDVFTYGLYRWASSAVHGGPMSVSECITTTSSAGTVAKDQPERKPTAQLSSAATYLTATAEWLVHDAKARRQFAPAFKAVRGELRALLASKPRGA